MSSDTIDLSGKEIFPEVRIEKETISDTYSAVSIHLPEQELVPYDCSRLSGSLDFWKEESEDIYTSDDGEPL
jgi:hypothetical protein